MNLAMTIIIDGDIGSAFETQLRREKRKCTKRLLATYNYAYKLFENEFCLGI
jgi:hypothetical protein